MKSPSVGYLVAKLQNERERTWQFFYALSPKEWDTIIYPDGGRWKPSQILAHLIAAERGFQDLIQEVLAGREGAPPDFDLQTFNERTVAEMADYPIERLLEEFRAARQATVDLVTRLSPQALELKGRHPWFGVLSLAEILVLLYRHAQIHQREIRRALSASEEDGYPSQA